MSRKKQRETYGKGSVTPEMVAKLDKDGNKAIGKDGRPVKVQRRNKHGELAWRVCITLGTVEYTDAAGNLRKRQDKHQQVVYGTLDHARKVCEQLAAQYEHVDASARDKTFSDACAAWETSMRNAATASENCLAGYMQNLRHVQKYLGDKPIVATTKQDVEDALAAVKTDRGLSNTTMHKVHALTKRVFAYCVDSDWIVRNPCAKIKAPRIDEVTNRRSLSSEECARLRACLDEAEAEAYARFRDKEARQAGWGNTFGRSCLRGLSELSCLIAIRIELATGLRRSEALALTWSAVDFDNEQITVCQKLIVGRRRGLEGGEESAIKIRKPKTKSGTRTLYVDADTLAHLAAWKAFQERALHLVMPEGRGLDQSGDTPVCVGDNGSWLRPSSLDRWWGTADSAGFRDKAGFPGLNMHELRHTQATQLLGAGVDVKTVQTRLGHAKASHTLDLYAHAIPANDKEAASIMGAIYGAPANASAPVVDFVKPA